MDVKTFVFLDCETTGLPAYEYNKTRITELSLVSVQSDHICLGVFPRVQNKLSLCFNPMKRIQPGAEEITGLYNDDLAQETSFNETSLNLLSIFLERLTKPICFVAHNGYRFDYPILRNHIESAGNKFPDDILCIDSLKAFREILNQTSPSPSTAEPVLEISDEWDGILCDAVSKLEENLLKTPPKSSDFDAQRFNETTPNVRIPCDIPAAPRRPKKSQLENRDNSKMKIQRRLNFGDTKTKKFSYKLSNLYEHLLQKPAIDAHQAEVDVRMLIECAVTIGDRFVAWANENAIFFNQIQKMEPGKKLY